ncbi:ATP-grasp domain-containing protein [Roseateles amylovorans]|uniref:ATP-grasp domain-containing protein n=1 Tax=Roseateles amylovorans TaxID=2978473 RepID=A0ABY6AZG3_9BURK|nr:ATP-grasp domain-containing protein [Roseateles amylovorans]UXH77799.1 ATP-grasp domain-containing protein [Roseateles amylovorans]
MPDVLLLGGRAPVTLDHARRFAHHGWRVHVADSISCRLSTSSRAVSGSVRLASPRHAPAEFVRGLREAITRWDIALIVPTCEEVFFLSRYRHLLPASVRVLADDFELLRALHSKWHFLQLAQGCGAGVPEAATVDSLPQARDWAGGRAVVLKPEFSRFGVHVRLYPDGIPADAPPLPPMGRWVVQQFIAGQEFSSYSVADRGRLLAHSLYRPAYRLAASASFYFEAARIEASRTFVEALVRKTGFTGQISFDWMLDAEGTLSVLECNPRATSGCHLFALADPLPDALAGISSALLEPSTARPRMLGPVMLSAGLAAAVRDGRLAEWRRDFQAAEDVIVAPGDRWPLIGAALDMGAYAALALRRRSSLREASTQDIEWDGQALLDVAG